MACITSSGSQSVERHDRRRIAGEGPLGEGIDLEERRWRSSRALRQMFGGKMPSRSI